MVFALDASYARAAVFYCGECLGIFRTGPAAELCPAELWLLRQLRGQRCRTLDVPVFDLMLNLFDCYFKIYIIKEMIENLHRALDAQAL